MVAPLTTDGNTGRSLSGPVRLELDFLDALQVQVALERRRYELRKRADEIRRARELLEITEASDDESVLAGSIAQTERAIRALEAACYGRAVDGPTEAELRALYGDR